MAPFLQFRLWLREAPKTERQVTGMVAVVLWVLIAAVLRPMSGGGPASGLDALTGQGTAVEPGASTAVAGQAPAPEAGLPAGPDAAVPDGAPAPAPAGGAPAEGAGPPAPAGAAPPGVAAPPGGAAPAPAPGPAGTQPLTASDRGVTPTTVKIGFVIGTLSGIEETGIAADLRDDLSEVVDAIVDDANKRGGMAGRKIVAAKATVDVTNPDSQRQGCLELTQTQKVFAIQDTASLSFAASRTCVAKENRTPLLTQLYPGGSNEFASNAPNLMAISQNDSRRVQNWVQAAKQAGFFDPAKGFKKLGILSDSCLPTVIDAKDGLKSALRQAGVPKASEFRMSCDVSSQQREAPNAVLQFRQDDVSHVFLASNTIADKTFTQSAESQAYRPQYFLSDFWALLNDVNTKLLQQDQIDGAFGVSQFNHGPPLSFPAVKRCNDSLVSHGLDPIKSFSRDYSAIIACDHLELVIKAGNAVGANLTRPNFANAVQSSGDFAGGFVHLARFTGPGKTSGGDQVQLLQWGKACVCWTPKGKFVAAR